MSITHYIAETDSANGVAAVWFKPSGNKTARVFDISTDLFDPNETAEFSGACEAEIKRWLVARSRVSSA